MDIKPQYLIGLAGVEAPENPKALKIDGYFKQILLFVAIALAFQWNFENKHLIHPTVNSLINFLVWCFFVIQTLILSSLVDNKRQYLRNNWFNLAVILSGVVLMVNQASFDYAMLVLRPVLFVALLLPWLQTFVGWLSDNSIMTTLGTFAVVLVLFGVVMSTIEPNISNPLEGIWFALVTITTVGYGDMVPLTFAGRLIASILIFTGLGLFAAITANFSAIFVRRGMKEELTLLRQGNIQIKKVLENIQAVKTEEDEILDTLNRVKKEESDIINRLKALKTEEDKIISILQFGKQDRESIKEMLSDIQQRLKNMEDRNAKNHSNG